MSECPTDVALSSHQQLARKLLVQLGDLQESLTRPIQPTASPVAEQRERVLLLARRLDDVEGLTQLCDLAEQLHTEQIGGLAKCTVSEEHKADIRRWIEEQDALPGHPGCILDINGTRPLSADELRVQVFDSVLSPDSCRTVVAAAENHGWTTGRHAAHPTVDISVFEVDAISGWLPTLVNESLVRPMEKHFGLLSPLTIDDCFVAKYEPDGQPGLGAHEDSSDWSFVVVLNDGFEGGGTRFENLAGKPVYQPSTGSAIGFNGQNRHSGLPVTKGVRYILAGFLMPADG